MSLILLGSSAWYKQELPSADKTISFPSRVPLMMALPVFRVFRFGAIPVTIDTFGLPSSLHGTFRAMWLF